MRVRGAPSIIEIWRKTEKQHVTQKIENRFFHRWVAALGRGDCALDDLSIFFAHGLAGREISSINGKAGDGFAHRARERLEREIAIPAVLLGQTIEHVAQNIDIVGQGEFHHLQFLCIQQMPKRHRVADETMEGFCNLRFGRGIDQQLRHLIRKIVASRSMHEPVLPQRFRGGENFFRQHINGASILR